MLFAFNSGDLEKFKALFAQHQGAQPVLAKHQEFLNQKLRIMTLMEMCFKRTSITRTLTFKDISTTCGLPLELVEVLLMKAFSLKVIKGLIDQVDQTVRIKWVQPRVLDVGQIASIETV